MTSIGGQCPSNEDDDETSEEKIKINTGTVQHMYSDALSRNEYPHQIILNLIYQHGISLVRSYLVN